MMTIRTLNLFRKMCRTLNFKYSSTQRNQLPSLKLLPSPAQQSYKQLRIVASDRELLSLIENDNHLFQDIVPFACSLIEVITSHNIGASDIQIIFLAFAFNMYHERFPSLAIYDLCINSLKRKLVEGVQKDTDEKYLEQLYFLSHRDINFEEKRYELIQNYFTFVLKKFKIDSILNINDLTLMKLWDCFPYIPEQPQRYQTKRGEDVGMLCHLEGLVMKTIEYEALRVVKLRQSSRQFSEHFSESVNKFAKLRQYCIRLSDTRHKLINPFPHFPVNFTNQEDFTFFITILKEFMNEVVILKIQKKEMNFYHQQLSLQNNRFRSAKSYRTMESYCQHLIFLGIYRPESFISYFDQQGPTYVTMDYKFISRH